jgi:hypothetical protein
VVVAAVDVVGVGVGVGVGVVGWPPWWEDWCGKGVIGYLVVSLGPR